MEDAKISIVSKQTVRPSPRKSELGDGHEPKRIHLTPWDLRMLPVHYIQKGILFHKPHNNMQQSSLIISNLLASFSQALDIFYPLAGRLVTTANNDDGSVSVSLDCTDEGAEFIHASAPDVTVSDILTPGNYYIPSVVRSFFPLNGAVNVDGHSLPLLATQVTELADGVFVACSLNHSVGDGTSFWRFFNTWSKICSAGGISATIEKPPTFDRWFPDSCPPPLHLPAESVKGMPMRPVVLQECAFDFPAKEIKKLKEAANEQMPCGGSGGKISSLQALLAHVWRSVTRVRHLPPEHKTTCVLIVGYRTRLSLPLPEAYLGNAVLGFPIQALAGDVERPKGLGWAAWQLNGTVGSQTEAAVYGWFEAWRQEPTFVGFGQFGPADVVVSSSPRFDVYGNDFGWGRPVAVRSGPGNKVEGKLTVYLGAEEGSMTLEVCLKAEELKALLEDREFMGAVA